MLMLSDPFSQLNRIADQALGTVAHPVAMHMDAPRERNEFVVAVDLPGVEVDSIELKCGKEHPDRPRRAEESGG